MFHWPHTLALLSKDPQFKKRYTTEDLPLLKAFLTDVKARNDHLDATVYANTVVLVQQHRCLTEAVGWQRKLAGLVEPQWADD